MHTPAPAPAAEAGTDRGSVRPRGPRPSPSGSSVPLLHSEDANVQELRSPLGSNCLEQYLSVL